MPFRVRVVGWAQEHERLRAIRHEVFVAEQRVPAELEWDGRDVDARHVIALDAHDNPIGCGRLLADGTIGRIAVALASRGRGVGGAILSRLIEIARYGGFDRIVLSAQTHALEFYARYGFVAAGEEVQEAGIAHRRMQRRIG